ncbi:MAG TPA: major capsid protein, partial [Acidimicrobiia bacterium]
MDLNQNFTALDADALATYAAQIRAAFEAIASLDAPTEAQVAEAEGYADHLDAIAAEQTARTEAAEALAARTAALRTRFSTEATEEVVEDETEDEDEAVAEGEVEEAPAAPAAPAAQARSGVQTLARRTTRPVKPAAQRAPLTITAAADVPDFAAGAKLGGLEQVGVAIVNRMRGFGPPSGDGTREDLRHVGVASFKLEFPSELTIDRHSDDMEVLSYAAKESRLPGGSLVAAGGWCAPSETIYDLCAGETTDGIISI